MTGSASSSAAPRLSEPPPLSDAEVAEIVADQDAALSLSEPAAGVAVVAGAGAKVTVRLGQLTVEDGTGPARRTRCFPRVAPPARRLSRLIVEASSGIVTLDALSWCRALGVVVVGLDRDGEPAWSTLPNGPRDARLTRALAVAGARGDDPVGLDIVANLLRAKLAGQAEVLQEVLGHPEAATTVRSLLDCFDDAASTDEARQLEASAAAVYFDAWRENPACVPVFAKRDASRVPASWATYRNRRSEIGGGLTNRRASHPTNALLNYLFTMVRSEAGIALTRLGLDPSLGVLHADTVGRDSLSCDLAEVARPAVERYMLQLLSGRSFRRADFLEGPSGEVRLGMSLRQELAASCPRWATVLAPHAEAIRNALARSVREHGASRSALVETAPLSGARRKAGAAEVRRRRADANKAAMSAVRSETPTKRLTPVTASLWSCPGCGSPVTNPRHVRCESCIGADPGQTPEIRANRGRAIAARKRALAEWERLHPGVAYDPDLFVRDILPCLAGVKVAAIMEAAGCSKSYASQIRSGKFTPHVSTWAALAELTGVDDLSGGH